MQHARVAAMLPPAGPTHASPPALAAAGRLLELIVHSIESARERFRGRVLVR